MTDAVGARMPGIAKATSLLVDFLIVDLEFPVSPSLAAMGARGRALHDDIKIPAGARRLRLVGCRDKPAAIRPIAFAVISFAWAVAAIWTPACASHALAIYTGPQMPARLGQVRRQNAQAGECVR